MKLRPVLSASAAGVLIAAASAVPSLATEEVTPREREVSVTPVAPSPEAEDEQTSSPPEDTESPSEEASEEAVDDDDAEDEEGDTEEPSAIEDLLEETADPVVRPSVQAPEPPPAPAEAPTRLETLNSPFAAADSGSNGTNDNSAAAEGNSQARAALPQNSGQANGEVSNSPFANTPSAQAETNNPGSAPEGLVFGPQNLPIVSAQDAPFVGADALAQALLDAQSPNDGEPVEETTVGTSEAPGRVESRRLVRPDHATDAVPHEASNPQDAGTESSQETRSAPQDSLVTTGAASALLAIGGILMIAGGAGILFWHRRLSN